MRQYTGRATMLGAEQLHEPLTTYFQLGPYNQAAMKFESKFKYSNIQEHAFENDIC